MSDQPVSSLWDQGTTKTYQIPINNLDYKFIEKCSDVKHLEKILRILRSGEEGYYPDLTLFCEKRIECLAPGSRALRKDRPPASASDFTAEEWEKINDEMKSWVTEMKEDDYKIQFPVTETLLERRDNLPAVRGSNCCVHGGQNKENKQRKKKNIPRDYREWDKFDVEKECSEVDEGYEENNPKARVNISSYTPVIEKEIDTTETGILLGGNTTRASEMGNVQKKFSGEGDGCKSKTQKHRVRKGISGKETAEHLPDHEDKVNGYLNNVKKKNENNDVKEETFSSHGTESSSPGKSIFNLLPPAAAELKSKGNELFKNGQFGEAVLKYSEAIENVINLGVQSQDDLSKLYSNRAACYFKEGNCRDCIQDCNRALELHPFSVKPLLRRAMAYESMERYRQAYVDYKTVLQIDSGIQAANDGVNRITAILIDQDGPSWRGKLPSIPVVPVFARLQKCNEESFTSETKQKKTADFSSDRQSETNSEKAEENFKTLKNEGNEFVKKGKYKEALMKYNECMKLNSKECAVYTNRALCYLKLCQYEEAKQDCDHVLQTEDSNIKAFYRRALAYKGLQNYQASVDDLSKVLIIDPNVAEAKRELQEVTQLLNLKSDVGAGSQQKQRKTIKIQEVNEDNEEGSKASTSEDAVPNYHIASRGAENSMPLKISEKLRISEPSNAYEFGQIINAVNAKKDETACADLLTIIDPKKLPKLLSNQLEGDTFLIFMRALECHLLGKNPDLVYQHLLYLSKVERFKVVLTLLNKSEKEQIQQLFDSLSKKQNHQFSGEDLECLKSVYEL
ncbi:sperm-associated antigen 1 isoform X2 [Carettochelys insculpta]|uniref:sperm-associated antigen 1 isoform X2 n=1 Tax=Carettochelys insculpta TaxID=44489 RepID=UPI003EBB8F03